MTSNLFIVFHRISEALEESVCLFGRSVEQVGLPVDKEGTILAKHRTDTTPAHGDPDVTPDGAAHSLALRPPQGSPVEARGQGAAALMFVGSGGNTAEGPLLLNTSGSKEANERSNEALSPPASDRPLPPPGRPGHTENSQELGNLGRNREAWDTPHPEPQTPTLPSAP